MFTLLSLYSDWAIFALRLVLGLTFLIHGWPKLKSLKTTAQNFGAMGFRPGFFWGPLVAIVEFFGGLAFLGGGYVQVAAALIAAEFAVIIIWKILKRQSFTMRVVEGFVGGLEFDLLIFAAALVLFAAGGGAYSLDRMFFFGGF